MYSNSPYMYLLGYYGQRMAKDGKSPNLRPRGTRSDLTHTIFFNAPANSTVWLFNVAMENRHFG